MGQTVAKLMLPFQNYGDRVVNKLRPIRKRSSSCLDSKEAGDTSEQTVQSPKRRKLLTTTQYIYKALFKEQKNSDVTIMALDNVWNLHKVYLSQSPYFHSMFNGSWIESRKNFIHIKIADERITVEALDSIFGSLYSDEIDIDAGNVVPILAAATLFHLDSIIDKCMEVMIETINVKTVISYYEAACQYGCQFVKDAAFAWLETNLMCIYSKRLKFLSSISIDLMTDLISSPRLYVMQTEFSIYVLLRCWMYLRLQPTNAQHQEHELQTLQMNGHQQLEQQEQNNTNGSQNSNCFEESSQSCENCANDGLAFASGYNVQTFLPKRQDDICFLATREGGQFLKPFLALRTQYLTNHFMDLKIILSDNILPIEWIHRHVLSHWKSILQIDHQPQNEGPQRFDEDIFDQHCMRCGRILLEPGYQKWRWTGFHFGLDLIFIADSRVLSIRRYQRNERLLSLQNKLQFMIRASVTSINEQRQPTFSQRSEILSLSLERNEEAILMIMENNLVYPLLVSVNLMITPPTSQTFKKDLFINQLSTNNTKTQVPISEIGTKSVQEAIDLPSILPLPPLLPIILIDAELTDRTMSSTSFISNTRSSESISSTSSDTYP